MAQMMPLISDVICSADFRLETSTADAPLAEELLRLGARLAAVANWPDPICCRTSTGTRPKRAPRITSQ
jgi:hypothetical protein